jgi:DNA mismatch repair protein MutS
LDAYLPKLVRAGYRVAVCDQLEDPKNARGIVRRGVVEVVTPGVALYDKLLETNKNNYLAAITYKFVQNDKLIGFAAVDISTGEFFCSEFPINQLNDVIISLSPSEIIISKDQKNEFLKEFQKLPYQPSITKLEKWIFEEDFGKEALKGHFKTKNLKGYGLENQSIALASAGAILYYINETQLGKLEHIRNISLYNPTDYMILDFATRRNLEITYSYIGDSKQGTLISILDKTCTAMGARLFKKWITRPLRQLNPIKTRLEIVKLFVKNQGVHQLLRQELNQIGDLERLISKISSGRANPRDVLSLKQSLKKIPLIKNSLNELQNDSVNIVANKLLVMDDLVEIIDNAIIDEPTSTIGSGNIFRHGYSEELDSYVEAKFSGKSWIANYQEEERNSSGISSLKVGFNNVFGYYIEVTRIHSNKVPAKYDRKQTLTNAERYTTPELKAIEEKILHAEDRISLLESNLFAELRNQIAERTEEIQKNAMVIASIDCLQSFAESAVAHNFCEPDVDESDIIVITNGRHPVVENLLELGSSFAPNNTLMDNENQQIHILTGPNMSGKSCYLRQVGLIVLLAQIGSFVPAEKARIGLVDRIFTRVGAQDNITSGESTFLVEMQEAANIMNNASSKSLILLDEVGRGTATFDGISIAWAITEYIHNVIGAKTLFATHYHELNDMAERYERIFNFKVEVIQAGDSIIFTHKVLEGASDHSFGIHVAQMAGLPLDITERADVIMRSFEADNTAVESEEKIQTRKADTSNIKSKKTRHITDQLSIFEFRDDSLREQINSINLDSISPMEALKILAEMQKKSKKR